MKKKILSSVLCVAICLSMLVGCSTTVTSDVKDDSQKEETSDSSKAAAGNGEEKSKNQTTAIKLDKDKLVVGVIDNCEPFCYKEDDEWKGYDIDIWKEFEKRTGISVEWMEQERFSDDPISIYIGIMKTNLLMGDIDVLVPENFSSDKVDYCLQTEPVSYPGITVAVAGEDDKIQSISDLSGEVNRCLDLSSEEIEDTIKAANHNIEINNGWEGYAYYLLSSLNALPLVLLDIEAQYTMKKDNNLNIRILEPVNYVDGCYLINNEDIQEAANTFIQSIKEDGTLKEISGKWFGTDVSAERK